jgi:hypothetical protein
LKFELFLFFSTKKKRIKRSQFETGFTGDGFVKTTIEEVDDIDSNTRFQITSFNGVGFQINNTIRVFGPIIIFPKTIYSWNINDFKQINADSLSLFKFLDPKPGI